MKVKNPKTGRMIEVGKSTYNDLIREGYVLQGTELVQPVGTGKIVSQADVTRALLSPMAQLTVAPIPTPGVIPPAQIIIPIQPAPTPFQPPQPVTPPQQQQQEPVKPRPLSGDVPDPTILQMELAALAGQEEAERVRMCTITDEWYLSRIRSLRPFMREDHGILKRIVPAIRRCSELCDAKILRAGRVPEQDAECQKYRNAAKNSSNRLNEIEAEMRASAIRVGAHGTIDIGQFFPQTPQ